MNPRTPALAAALVAVAATATGCTPLVKADKAEQRDLIGDVAITTTLCQPGFAQPADVLGCTDADDQLEAINTYANPGTIPYPHQLLMAYRVPAGADAPESFTVEAPVVEYTDWLKAIGGQVGQPLVDDRGRGSLGLQPETKTITFRRDADVARETVEAVERDNAALPEELAEGGEAKLERDGTELAGYLSDLVPGTVIGDLDVQAGFGLPDGPDGKPYAGPFNRLSMAGWRLATNAEIGDLFNPFFGFPISVLQRSVPGLSRRTARVLPTIPTLDKASVSEDRPVVCAADDLLNLNRGGPVRNEPADCPQPQAIAGADSPDEWRPKYAALFDGVDLDTRDVTVRGGEAFAEQGQTATVPFTLRAAGPAGGGDLTVSAAPAVPGSEPSTSTLAFPGTGDHARSVEVKVPEAATPGTYDVALKLTAGDEVREAVAKVVVLPKPAAAVTPPPVVEAPPAAPPAERENLYVDGDGNLRLGVLCGVPGIDCGTLTFDVLGPKAGIAPGARTAQAQKPRLLRIGRTKVGARRGTRRLVEVPLVPKARRAIARGRTVKGLVVIRGRDGKPFVRRVVIARRK